MQVMQSITRLRFTLIKNAIANVARGGAAAFVALLLPHFLVHSLGRDRFAAWSLLLQIAAYASYLDFGLQTAVARHVAHATELGQEERRNALVSTALGLLIAAGALALLVVLALVWQLPHLFREIPPSLLAEVRLGVLLLGGAAALLLPFSAWSGILIGLHRNEYVALAIGGSRVLGALAVVVVSRRWHSLALLAALIAAANLLGCLMQFVTVRRLLPVLRISWSRMRRTLAAELARYCGGLSVWSLSMFLVSGLDLTVVGYFDFKAVGYYAVASSLVTIFAGANSAVCSALMTPVAALHASGQRDRIRTLTLAATRLNTYLNVLATVGIFVFGPFLLRVWVGPVYAHAALPIVKVLMVANAIRLIGNPYASMLIAVDQQRHGIAQGVAEGVTNFGASILGALRFGAIGVAWGTLVGAIAGVLWICTLTLNWVREVAIGRWIYVREGILRPVLCSLPLIAFIVISRGGPLAFNAIWSLLACAAATYVLTRRFGMVLPSFLRSRGALTPAG